MTQNGSDFFMVDASWNAEHAGAKAGMLVVKNIDNVPSDEGVDELLARIEGDLREKFGAFSREGFNKIPEIEAYNYYKNFGKTYHVRPQVESVVHGKSLPKISALLSCMFAMEVKNMLLTAGHDLESLKVPVCIKSGTGNEEYVIMNGSTKKVEKGDMFMQDGEGIISSIVQGPDARTKITSGTTDAVFAVYAPKDITKDAVRKHLEDIRKAILIFSPGASTELLEVLEAG